jgi:hypothetical protein
MLGTITKGEYKNDPLPDNVYLAKLIGVKEKAAPEAHPDWYPSLSWTFEILQDPFKKRRAWGKTPTNWIVNKKLDNWLVACGINVSKGTSLKIEDLKDIYVKILVKGKPYVDPQTKENKVFSSVTELLPLDSLDQIKIRELIAGTNVVASATTLVTPSQQPAFVPVSGGTTTGGFVPSTTSAPLVTPPYMPQPTFTPAPTVTGTPSRTIPF